MQQEKKETQATFDQAIKMLKSQGPKQIKDGGMIMLVNNQKLQLPSQDT